jgi:2-oxoglutarate/2-oxoacid ferredoxin oxidoreductase subunit beta
MSIQEPPQAPVNLIGLTRNDYKGLPSTLCKGCGHDSISARIISVAYDLSINPTQLIKMSGIGCSSKTPAYFLNQSHGFNSLHGRMPSATTGALLANHTLKAIGVSGDGDTTSIGIGQFIHLVRRNVPMVYIVENNGVYGLTKGQFSATADKGSKNKRGVMNTDSSIDMIGMAMQLGASFVARSFSGDKEQLVPLLKAAITHNGAAFIDVISPCVAFNSHLGSTKSFDFVREHNEAVNRLDFITGRAPITVDYEPGTVEVVTQHDGSTLRLRKVAPDYDVHNRIAAMNYLQERQAAGEVVTGLLYLEPQSHDLHDYLNTVETPFNELGEAELIPGAEALQRFNQSLR